MSILELERQDGVMVIRMNRPDRMNALGAELRSALADAWCEFRDSSTLEVAIFTGTGRAFCAGEDMKESLERGTAGSGSAPGARPAPAPRAGSGAPEDRLAAQRRSRSTRRSDIGCRAAARRASADSHRSGSRAAGGHPRPPPDNRHATPHRSRARRRRCFPAPQPKPHPEEGPKGTRARSGGLDQSLSKWGVPR